MASPISKNTSFNINFRLQKVSCFNCGATVDTIARGIDCENNHLKFPCPKCGIEFLVCVKCKQIGIGQWLCEHANLHRYLGKFETIPPSGLEAEVSFLEADREWKKLFKNKKTEEDLKKHYGDNLKVSIEPYFDISTKDIKKGIAGWRRFLRRILRR